MAQPSTAPARGRRAKRPTGDEREELIRETLEKLLEQKNFHQISIDDLARGAGISRPSFYFYFESKEAVLLALMDEIVGQADAASDLAQAAIADDPQRFLRDALAAYVHILGEHRGVVVACNQAAAASPEVRDLWNIVRERWVQMAVAGIDAERERASLPATIPSRELAIALLSMNEGVMYSAFAGEDPSIAADRVIDVLTHVWANAVYEGRELSPTTPA
jgi:AcrR family transcriptional regulator